MEKPMRIKMSQWQIFALILNEFDIPDSKRDIDDMSNVEWLIDNIGVKNSDNPRCDKIIQVLKIRLETLKTPESS